MELERKVIRVEGRNLIFVGTEHKGMLDVTHVVDSSRGKMFSFYHRHFMGKNPQEPFECSDRRKINASVRRKYGINTALCFEHYTCSLSINTDEHGDNTIALLDRRDNKDILQGFAEKHWELAL